MADAARSEDRVITNGIPSQLPDIHPQETQEWIDSLDAVIEHEGRARARYILLRVLERARQQQVGVPALRSTDYINTIPPENEPWFPGDEHIERRIRAFIRWNAAVMVSRANRPEVGVGGHIATYASAASLYEVGFNHFFRGKGGNGAPGRGGNRAAGKSGPDGPQGGDQVYIQGHAVPGIYARAYLEGRLTEEHLDGFRQESKPHGIPSYPHPRLMPDFWEFPTVSMGLGALNAVYQARFNRYLLHRGITDTSGSRVWCFLGDGEMDEPEAIGPIGVAGREELDNLVFVVNCNLQRLDGPVRGNGKIIQELESLFRGAGWNVIKVVWGRDWDELLARDTDGVLVNKMNTTPDGQFQTYSVESGDYIRENFFGDDPRLRKIVEHLSDEDLTRLSRGGHDYRKVYAAFDAAVRHTGQPTVILAQTIKGWTLEDFEARNAAHQMKKLTDKALKKFRDRLYLDISDEQLEQGLPPYYHPGEDSDEIEYLHERRQALGGYVPRRVVRVQGVDLPARDVYAELKQGSAEHEVATTMAFVRQLRELFKHEDVGDRLVPIIPDEARTFGMDSLFPQQKIYSPFGQTYDPVDRHMLLSYQEAVNGQIIHEGITEAGSMGTFHAAGSSYATFDQPMLPVYVFYSMFGFQRTGDLMWSAGDQRARGFLIGATAGRTTLNGEGLQHEDGHSVLLAASNPAVVAYDPSFAYEIAVIVEDGIERMLGHGAGPAEGGRSPDVMYYLTVYNEPVVQPPMPEGLDESRILAGLYRYTVAEEERSHRAQLLASGSGMRLALQAKDLLADDWDVAADVWSAPAWAELQREALACEEWNQLHPGESPRVPYVTRALNDTEGPIVAVSDWMKAVPGLISRWVPRQYAVLGTDGFGRSDTRVALRRQFRIDAESIVVATLHELAAAGQVKTDTVAEAIDRYGIDPEATTELP